MSKEESELIISNEPEIGENTMYVIPSNLSSLKLYQVILLIFV